jgi:hypothetical protein
LHYQTLFNQGYENWGVTSSLVHFAFLASFSGSSSTSYLSEALPLSVSASEIETLLGSLPILEDSAIVLCFFFFFLERVPLPAAC